MDSRVRDDDQKVITFTFYFTNVSICGVTRKKGKIYGSDLNYLMSPRIYLGLFCFNSLREKCPYSEFFWSVFSRIRTEYREDPYSVRTWENTDQENSEYGHFSSMIISEISSYKKGNWYFFKSHFRPILLYLQRPPSAKLAKLLLFVDRPH